MFDFPIVVDSSASVEFHATGSSSQDQFEHPKVGFPAVASSTREQSNILIFLKWFDLDAQTIHGQFPMYVTRDQKIRKLFGIIVHLMRWRDDEHAVKISLFEEIKPGMIEQLNPEATFGASEIQHGDIICFMREESYRYVFQKTKS